jgi:hypothetical protein
MYDVQADYGYGHGWETVTCEVTRKEARERLKEYRANDPMAFALRIKKYRERIENTEQ